VRGLPARRSVRIRRRAPDRQVRPTLTYEDADAATRPFIAPESHFY
jgi:hypothetical protein